MYRHGSHKDGSVVFSLTVIHSLSALHSSVGALCRTELLGFEAISGQVRADRSDEAFDRFHRVIRVTSVARSRGSLVEGLTDPLQETPDVLVSGILWIGQDHAGFVGRWKLGNLFRQVATGELTQRD
jgi:hypothetical protein